MEKSKQESIGSAINVSSRVSRLFRPRQRSLPSPHPLATISQFAPCTPAPFFLYSSGGSERERKLQATKEMKTLIWRKRMTLRMMTYSMIEIRTMNDSTSSRICQQCIQKRWPLSFLQFARMRDSELLTLVPCSICKLCTYSVHFFYWLTWLYVFVEKVALTFIV